MAARTQGEAELRSAYFAKPGLHSYNLGRRLRTDRRWRLLYSLRTILFVIGLAGVGYYGYALANQYVYQRYENWAFDQHIGGYKSVTFADYLRNQTPFGFLVGKEEARPIPVTPSINRTPLPSAPILPEGAVLGRLSIDRLNLSAMVRQGVTAQTLGEAVGHVPSTALAGQTGNFAIAAHRDTLFRALKDIKKDDLVTFQSDNGTYTYKVLATKIVKPSDVSVIRPDGGGLIAGDEAANSKLLTMITCYPFYYVGSAPKRFIVEGALVQSNASASPPGSLGVVQKPAASPPHGAKITKQASLHEPRHTRGSSHLSPAHRTTGTQSAGAQGADSKATSAKKRKGFWRRIFGSSQG